VKGTVSRDFIVFLPILTVRWYFLVRYFFVKSIKIGPLISHIFRITNHRSLFLLKTSIYIQIVIRWASIHRLSICIIVLPTTAHCHAPSIRSQRGTDLLVTWRDETRVHSHAPSIRSHRGIKVVWPDFQPMRVPEEPVCVHLFRQKPVFTSLHLKSPVHVHRLRSLRDYSAIPVSISAQRVHWVLYTQCVGGWRLVKQQADKLFEWYQQKLLAGK